MNWINGILIVASIGLLAGATTLLLMFFFETWQKVRNIHTFIEKRWPEDFKNALDLSEIDEDEE